MPGSPCKDVDLLSDQSGRTATGSKVDRLDAKLGHCQLSLSEFKFNDLDRAGLNHQTVDELSQLNSSGTDQRSIDDDGSILCITPPTDEKEDASVSYMDDNDIYDYKEDVWLPTVYAFDISTEPEPDER